MSAAIQTKRFIRCLACPDGDFSVEHLIDSPTPSNWGVWYCDKCGAGHKGTAGNGAVDYQLTGGRLDRPAVLLKLDPEAGDVYIVVRGYYWAQHNDGKAMPEGVFVDEGQRYYYEESTCPVNFLGAMDVIEVTPDGADGDPHGLFKYVGARGDYDEEGAIAEQFGVKP